MTLTPTAEQRKAVELFSTGRSLVVEAGAGTGKTSTLVLMAESTGRRGVYMAFNHAIVDEAKRKMPPNVVAKTVHSFAWNAVIRRSPGLKARLASKERLRSDQLAQLMGVDPFVCKYGEQTKVVQPGHIASLAMRSIANFCNSDDVAPGPQHVPYVDGIDLPRPDGRRTFENNDALRRVVVDLLPGAWADLSDPNGKLPYRHDHYLKFWELHRPSIDADFVLFDEGQDASPVMRSIVEQQRQRGTQVVYVGDSQQAIYTWRGAVNALDLAETDDRTFITQSFRFGPVVVDAANQVLSVLEADLRLTGTESIPSVIEPAPAPKAILCRTNAVAVEHVLEAQKGHRMPA